MIPPSCINQIHKKTHCITHSLVHQHWTCNSSVQVYIEGLPWFLTSLIKPEIIMHFFSHLLPSEWQLIMSFSCANIHSYILLHATEMISGRLNIKSKKKGEGKREKTVGLWLGQYRQILLRNCFTSVHTHDVISINTALHRFYALQVNNIVVTEGSWLPVRCGIHRFFIKFMRIHTFTRKVVIIPYYNKWFILEENHNYDTTSQ